MDAIDASNPLGAAQSYIEVPPEKLGPVRHVVREMLKTGKVPPGSNSLFDSITKPVLKSN